MNDFYTEQLIKKQTTMKDIVLKAVLVAFAIASVLAVLITPLGLIIPIVVIALVTFLIRRLDVEYEYLYVNGDLDIDKIMSKSKRKNVFSANIEDMELLAPLGSPQLDQYRNAREIDLSSGTASGRKYALIVSGQGELKKLIFEPNDTIVEGIFVLAPRKVVRK